LGGKGGPATGFHITIGCEQRAGTFLLSGQHAVPSDAGQDRVQFLSSLSPDGGEIAHLVETKAALDFQDAHLMEKEMLRSFFTAYAIGPDGFIYTAPSRDDYRIEVYRPDGGLVRTIEREFRNRPRTPRENRRVEAIFASATRQLPGEVRQTLEETNQVIAGLFVDAAGNLWVKHCRSGDDRSPGVLLTYDLFDPEGRYVQEVSVAGEGNPLYDDLEFLPDGRVLLIKGYVLAQWSSFDFGTVDWNDEEEVSPLEVICCRLID
jgi:hypothetical protein